MRKTITLLLCVCTLLCLTSLATADGKIPLSYGKGDKIQDFTFTTYEGETITLSDVLQEKEAVLINIWATWCGPCRNEFPFLQEAYQQYQDRIEVIALSCEPTDTAEVLADFAAKYGLTFKIGQDPVDFLSAFGIGSIPTSFIVDRFGTICFVASGSMPDAESFMRLFDAFLGEEYTESVVYNSLPPSRPDVLPSSEAEISAALEADTTNPASTYTWPMRAIEVEGRNVVVSTNQGQSSTTASITATVEAKANDAIVVTFKTSTESVMDLLHISVNQKLIKVFGGEHDWMTYAIPVASDGTYTVTMSYIKDETNNGGLDTVWVDCISVVSGSKAAAAIEENPVYPAADVVNLSITAPDAKEIQISDPRGILPANFGDARYYIINGDTAAFTATLPAEYDPESAFFYCNFDGSITAMSKAVSNDRYEILGGVDSIETTRYPFTCMYLYPDIYGSDVQCIVYFKDAYNADQFVQGNNLGEWSYVALPAADEMLREDTAPSISEYLFKCIDQEGLPVAGVMLQVCDEGTCQILISDAEGIATLSATPYAWEVHILKAPTGYTAESTETAVMPVTGGEHVFTLTRN